MLGQDRHVLHEARSSGIDCQYLAMWPRRLEAVGGWLPGGTPVRSAQQRAVGAADPAIGGCAEAHAGKGFAPRAEVSPLCKY